MAPKPCRLCFKEKQRPLGIFAARGIKLKIAEKIQKHLSDEVSENDAFPKFVCADCWTKLKDFHEFYDAVNEAKSTFMKNAVKEEFPNFVAVDCDLVDIDGELSEVKHEQTECVVIEDSTSAHFVSETIENDVKSDLEETEKDTNGQLAADTFDNDEVSNESDGDDSGSNWSDGLSMKMDLDINWEMTNVAMATPIASELAEYADKKNGIDDLVAKYMNMTCDACDQSFETVQEGRDHYRIKHDKRPVIINCCDRRLRLYHIRDHLRYHMNPDIFKCKVCGKQFVTATNLKSHMHTHKPKRFECDICKKRFTTRDQIRLHLSTHASERQQYGCQICPKRFDTKSGITQHVRNVHERVGEVVCHICAKVYSSKVRLRVHLMEHSGVERPRAFCDICGNSFKSEETRDRHVKVHQEQSVKCPHCDKISPNKNALKSHIVSVHSKPTLECHFCVKKFKNRLALKEHVATHTGEDLYQCNYCPQKFKYHSSLYLHYRGVHQDEWNADRKVKIGRRKPAET